MQGLPETLKPMDTQLWAASCLEVSSGLSLFFIWMLLKIHCKCIELWPGVHIWVLPVPRTLADNLLYKLHVFVKATAHIQRVQAENNLSPSILTFCSEVCVCVITSSSGAYANHRKTWEWEPLCLSWCPLLKQYLICIDVSSYFYFYVVCQGFKEKLNPLNFWDGGKLLCLCVCVCKTLCVTIKCY